MKEQYEVQGRESINEKISLSKCISFILNIVLPDGTKEMEMFDGMRPGEDLFNKYGVGHRQQAEMRRGNIHKVKGTSYLTRHPWPVGTYLYMESPDLKSIDDDQFKEAVEWREKLLAVNEVKAKEPYLTLMIEEPDGHKWKESYQTIEDVEIQLGVKWARRMGLRSGKPVFLKNKSSLTKIPIGSIIYPVGNLIHSTEEAIEAVRAKQVEFLKPKERKSIKTWYNLRFVYLDNTSEDIEVRDRVSAFDNHNITGQVLKLTNKGKVHIYKANKEGYPSPGTIVYSIAEDKRPTQDAIDAANTEWKAIEARRRATRRYEDAPIKRLAHNNTEVISE